MRQYVCDRCKRIINGGMHDRLFVWHRRIQAEDHEGHYDICAECDQKVVEAIMSYVP